jgi:hypothetical protein
MAQKFAVYSNSYDGTWRPIALCKTFELAVQCIGEQLRQTFKAHEDCPDVDTAGYKISSVEWRIPGFE